MGMSLKQIKYLYAIGVFKGKFGDKSKKSPSAAPAKPSSKPKGPPAPSSKPPAKTEASAEKKKSLRDFFSRRSEPKVSKRLSALKDGTPAQRAKQIDKLLSANGSVKLQAGIRSYTAHKTPVTGEVYLKSGDKSIYPGDKGWPTGRIDILPTKKNSSESALGKIKKFSSDMFAEMWAQKNLPDPFSDLSPRSKEHQSLLTYRGTGYHDINNGLRKIPPKQTADVSHIDKAFKEFAKPLEESLQVHRGVRDGFARDLQQKFERGELGIGSLMKDEGYLSTTLSQGIRDDFMSYSDSKASFTLTLPKGNKVMWMGKNSESELLVPRGSTIKITGVEKRKRKLRGSDSEEEYLEFIGEFVKDRRWG